MGNITSICVDSTATEPQFEDERKNKTQEDVSPRIVADATSPSSEGAAPSPKDAAAPTPTQRKDQFLAQTEYNEWFKKTNGDLTVAGDRPSEQINYTNKKQLDTVWSPKADVKLEAKDVYQ